MILMAVFYIMLITVNFPFQFAAFIDFSLISFVVVVIIVVAIWLSVLFFNLIPFVWHSI